MKVKIYHYATKGSAHLPAKLESFSVKMQSAYGTTYAYLGSQEIDVDIDQDELEALVIAEETQMKGKLIADLEKQLQEAKAA